MVVFRAFTKRKAVLRCSIVYAAFTLFPFVTPALAAGTSCTKNECAGTFGAAGQEHVVTYPLEKRAEAPVPKCVTGTWYVERAPDLEAMTGGAAEYLFSPPQWRITLSEAGDFKMVMDEVATTTMPDVPGVKLSGVLEGVADFTPVEGTEDQFVAAFKNLRSPSSSMTVAMGDISFDQGEWLSNVLSLPDTGVEGSVFTCIDADHLETLSTNGIGMSFVRAP